jgi:Raf kinase inhibitor-like YbhB/YbcL family protein
VTTPAFANQPGCAANMAAACATFPRDNTNFGMNISPAMSWTGAPANTQSFVVLLQDLTNTSAHWVLWNIPGSVTMLAENVPRNTAMPAMPAGSQQAGLGSGANDHGYFGPGACGNVYEFVVYALSVPTFSPTNATNQGMVRTQLQALGTSILGTASMRARSFMPNCP